jgi:two-component system nitrogen regulation response regulator GlnG
VMASGQTVHIQDLPPELQEASVSDGGAEDWEATLRRWADRVLGTGKEGLLDDVTPRIERIMIETALQHTGGRRQDAARLLGWGRNTLTRKIKELGLDDA